MRLKYNLYRQLIAIVLIVFAIIYISVAVILPKALIPIYEKNIYFNLKIPLDIVQDNISDSALEDNIAYIFFQDSVITTSNNLTEVIDLPANQVLEEINNDYGKYTYQGKTYY